MRYRLPVVTFVFAAATAICFSTSASADLTKFSNDVSFTDLADYNPALSNDDNTASRTVTITDLNIANAISAGGNGDITGVSVSIASLNHSWMSDLIVRLRHVESNRVATLFARVGITESGGSEFLDNQNFDGDGDGSDFSGSYRFRDGGDSLWDAAEALGDQQTVPGFLNDAGQQTSLAYAASGVENGTVSLTQRFGINGQNRKLSGVEGDWVVEFSDRSSVTQPNNQGRQGYGSVSLTFETAAIPEPGTMTVLALAGLSLFARRRKA